jgi:hypothetical protein
MNTQEHTFPMPEIESHKLEEIAEHLPHRSLVSGADEFLRGNIWMSMAAAIFLGGLIGFSLRNSPKMMEEERQVKKL